MADNNIGKPLTMVEKVTEPNSNTNVIINDNGYVHQVAVNDLLKNSDVNTSLEINGSKNILPNSIKSGTYNGGTITVNKDGSVTINGTFTATTSLSLSDNFLKEKVTEGKTYILSGCPAGGGFSNNYKVDIISGGSSLAVDTGSGVEFTPSSTHINADSQACRIVIYAGTYSNLVFYPMVRLKGTSATYQPYADTNHNLSKDLIDVKNTLAPKQSVLIKDLYNVSSYTLPCDGYLFMNSWGVFSYTINIDDVFTFILTNNSPKIPIFLKAGTQIKLSNVNNEGGHLDFAGYQN